MSDPKVDIAGHRYVGPDWSPSGDGVRTRLEAAAEMLRAGGDDVAGARSLLVKAEETMPTLDGEGAVALRRAMRELRDALPASGRDGTLRLDEDVAVVPGTIEPHFHAIEAVGIAADAAHISVFVAESAHVAGAATAAYVAVPAAIFVGAGLAFCDFMTVESRATEEGLLHAAFGGMGGGSPGWAAGMGAALRDLRPADRAALRDAFDGVDRARFDEAYALATEARRDDPDAFADAQAEYGRAFRSYTDGLAAGTQGWSAEGRGPLFERGRADARRRLRGPDGAAVRAVSQEHKLAGFRAAMNDDVDGYRYENDPHYRSGVSHFRRTGAEGPDAMARELRRLDLVGEVASGRARIGG